MIQKSKKFRKGIFCVVYSREKEKDKEQIMYLLLRRKLHWKGWEFVKGKIEKSEKKSEAARRETMEETGLKIKGKIKRFKISGKYLYHKKLKDRPGVIGQTYTLFSAEVIKSNRIKLDKKEHSSWKWISYKEAVKTLKWPNQEKCLKIVDSWLNRNH